MKRIPLYSLVIALAASGCNKAAGQRDKYEEPPVPEQTEAVRLQSARVVIKATGTVEARNDVTVVAEAPGKAKKVLFELGDEVTEGQALINGDKLKLVDADKEEEE